MPSLTPFTHADYDALSRLVHPSALNVQPYAPKIKTGPPATAYVPGSRKKFEEHAFDELHSHRGALGINCLWRCKSARTDGILQLDDMQSESNVILLEIKTTLSWGSFTTAMGEFISATTLLRETKEFSSAKQGLIVFESFSSDWVRGHKNGLRPWALLYRHLLEMKASFQMAALQLRGDEFYNPFLDDAVTPGKIGRLFRPYLAQDSTHLVTLPPPHWPK